MTDFEDVAGRMPPPPPRPIEYRDLDDRGWWLAVLSGVALVAVGVWMLTNLFESVVVLALLVGASLIVGGVLEVVALGGSRGLGWLGWLGGGVLILAGVMVMAWPDVTLWVIAFLAGVALLFTGTVRAITALANRDDDTWPVQLGLGGLGMALGAVILAWPDATLVVLAVSVGLRAIASGLVAIGTGWQMHRLAA
ncbi:MAG TPA: DUF308 domain-containing protein [Acidimicrobiales bacterium]|nr:DUF308 domain-containing protein [Acidimicrobiales bacterium]